VDVAVRHLRNGHSLERQQNVTAESDDHWLVINGRRGRKTDLPLPNEGVEALKSYVGKDRSGVRIAKKANDADGTAAARNRVNLAKHGLG
jgi:hypothetical protein